jgi:hypothetical protein
MTVTVTHSTPADGSFSTTGAAAWNADHTLTGVGTVAEQNANAVAITGGAIDATTVGTTTPAAGTFTTLTATGQTSLGGAAGSESLRVLTSASAGGFIQAQTTSSTQAVLQIAGSANDYNLAFSAKGTGNLRFLTNAATLEQMRVSPTASAVNYVQVTGNITNNAPSVISAGSDAAVGLALSSKSTGTVSIFSNSANSNSRHLDVTHTGSVVNRFQLTGAITGNGVTLGVNGSDTNISQVFQSKGTGAIDLAAGSSGVNISNGGTVTAITRTAGGSGYTTAITATLSAPTTAGGVQATANAYAGSITAAVTSGGTGYTLNDVITVVGGTGIQAQAYTVSAVSGGVITAVTVQSFGQYTALPTNPVSVTGGTGSGATFTLSNWSMTSIAVNNAGSGYVEQPTVTFSGGGGSGAAAYAVVGTNLPVKGLGNSIDFYVPEGIGFRVSGASSSGGAYWMSFAGSTTPIMRAVGSTSGIVETGSAVPIQFRTNGATSGVEQFRIAHTASAVNYVQVTGAATGGFPTVSAQGSDATVSMWMTTKGTGAMRFLSGNSAYTQLRIDGTVSAVNSLNVLGSVAGSAPVLGVQGSDTNIDLTLTPKGTGNVRFGTYTANMALTVQGYVEIKDSGGTVRRLAVIA